MDTEQQIEQRFTPDEIEPAGSPLLPRSLVQLYFSPSSFFGEHLALGKRPYLLLVLLTSGIAAAIGRVDQQLLKADLGATTAGGPLDPLVGSWPTFWAFVTLFGALWAFFYWYVGGWWYKVRVGWSGHKDPDPKQARLVYVYAGFVHSLPAVALCIVATLLYSSYAEYWSAEEFWSALILIFPFWALVVSYKGVREVFDVRKWGARLWFLILPIVVYSLVFGLIGALFALQDLA